MIRVFLDTSVLVSAIISTQGAPAEIIDLWRSGAFTVIVSPKLLEELRTVVRRPKFRRFFTTDDVEEFASLLEGRAVVVGDPADEPGLTPDPKDDYLVALARAVGAHVLVSGDAHLTGLRIDPPILTPRAFLEAIAQRP